MGEPSSTYNLTNLILYFLIVLASLGMVATFLWGLFKKRIPRKAFIIFLVIFAVGFVFRVVTFYF